MAQTLFLAVVFHSMASLALMAESLPARVALIGGSSSATTYLPEEEKHHHVLQNALKERYPGQEVEVFNFADNGEFIARYLLNGRYSKDLASMQGKNIDIAILRCGINDSKYFSIEEFAEQTRRFINLLKADFPGIQIIIETGFYLDYPKHYRNDRNRLLAPYWEVNRQIAKELGLPLSDLYHESEKATKAGQWDLRIRSQNDEKYPKKPTQIYWGTELDEEYGSDPNWFSDVHPSPNGVRLAVAVEVDLLKRTFPERLPSGTGAALVGTERPQDFYVEWLGCDPERLKQKRKNPDLLQDATR